MKCSACNYQYFKRDDGIIEVGEKPFNHIVGVLISCPKCGTARSEISDKEICNA